MFFLKRFAFENKKNIGSITEEGLNNITGYDWPGNIRELRNVIHRAVVLSSGNELEIDDFPAYKNDVYSSNRNNGNIFTVKEKELVLNVLNNNNWNISASARELGLSRGSLRHRIKKYSIQIG